MCQFMRLAYMIGYGVDIEKSSVNRYSEGKFFFSFRYVIMFLNGMTRIYMILQANPRMKHFNIQRKPLPLEPSSLLREANRRRASLSVGNVSELLDVRPTDG
ncbi:hypothetical protein GW17_00028744 [Ensete ventricosum]|uniref:Uncharacterized protein n=1 Tax=Ensete ventricosum TaxID=4639 RepID=A0A444EC01_ENSVE|nr:hypothetical protein B296_00001869 [Ensete ventricosum]RWW07854.1 hypothetical protein GW17_00028744 [Ensete ventricosum]RZS13981.1 hypothetical protein BHM03_00045629 [Ensete ventricosum]